MVSLRKQQDNGRLSWRTMGIRSSYSYTEMSLIRLASVLGANDAVGDKNLPFPGTKLFSVGVVLNNVFSKLFEAIEAGETIDMPVEVKQAIHFYFHQLGVDIEDRLKGLYYSIPD